MRIYRVDGTFEENENDTEFGWYFSEILVDENVTNFKEVNKQNVLHSPQQKSLIEESFMESVDIVEPVIPVKPIIVQKINPNIAIEPIQDVLDCKMDIEGVSVKKEEPKLLPELQNINYNLPSREELANLIIPCNTETKMLLSVIYFAKFKTLIKQETSEELFKTVNLKTTNFKHLINDEENNTSAQMYKEIQHYHATKEDNMLSLMMELILSDMDCHLEDIVDTNQPTINENSIPQFVLETSDLGNSIQSSYSSKEGNLDKTNYLQVPNRSSILSSLGLSEEDKSIQSLCEETFEMHFQLAEIKKSFQEEENRVNQLIKMASALESELKETLYLNDLLHLLKGDVEKVKSRKLPFQIFHKAKKDDYELNLIV